MSFSGLQVPQEQVRGILGICSRASHLHNPAEGTPAWEALPQVPTTVVRELGLCSRDNALVGGMMADASQAKRPSLWRPLLPQSVTAFPTYSQPSCLQLLR